MGEHQDINGSSAWTSLLAACKPRIWRTRTAMSSIRARLATQKARSLHNGPYFSSCGRSGDCALYSR